MYLARSHYGAEENAFTCPLLERDLKVGLGSIDVDERNEDGWDGDFGTGDDIGDKGSEWGVLGAARETATATGRGGAAHGVVDGIHDTVDDVF